MFERKVAEQREKPSPRETLLKLEAEGLYVFHGSSKKLDKLDPRQAQDLNLKTGKMERHGEPGVSSTPYAEIAIFRSLTSSDQYMPHKYSTSFGHDADTGKLNFSANKHVLDNVKDKIGYVYVFKKSDFREFSEMEMRADKSVTPVKVIEVTARDLPKDIELNEKGN